MSVVKTNKAPLYSLAIEVARQINKMVGNDEAVLFGHSLPRIAHGKNVFSYTMTLCTMLQQIIINADAGVANHSDDPHLIPQPTVSKQHHETHYICKRCGFILQCDNTDIVIIYGDRCGDDVSTLCHSPIEVKCDCKLGDPNGL